MDVIASSINHTDRLQATTVRTVRMRPLHDQAGKEGSVNDYHAERAHNSVDGHGQIIAELNPPTGNRTTFQGIHNARDAVGRNIHSYLGSHHRYRSSRQQAELYIGEE